MFDTYIITHPEKLAESYAKFSPEMQKVIDKMATELAQMMMQKIDNEIYHDMQIATQGPNPLEDVYIRPGECVDERPGLMAGC